MIALIRRLSIRLPVLRGYKCKIDYCGCLITSNKNKSMTAEELQFFLIE